MAFCSVGYLRPHDDLFPFNVSLSFQTRNAAVRYTTLFIHRQTFYIEIPVFEETAVNISDEDKDYHVAP